jgi:hypothetical protein
VSSGEIIEKNNPEKWKISELVRVAIGTDIPELTWPACCPECGNKTSLVKSTSRLGQVKSVRPNLRGGLTMRSEILYLTYQICAQHASATKFANSLLEKSPLMYLLRFIVYVGIIFAIGLLLGPRPWNTFPALGMLLILPAVGILGTAGIVWARRTTSLWPIRFDPDQDVIEIRFSQEKYAAKFRALNREATNSDNSAPLPWYQRGIVLKIVAILLVIAFFAKVVNR